MNKFEEFDKIKEAWKQDTDSSVIKAATEDWEEYPPHVQAIIEAEAKNRGLWEKVLYLKGKKTNEPISKEGNLEGYVCEACRGTYLNFETGRCMRCELPSDSMGYCVKCDKFWSLRPAKLCPKDSTELIRSKVPSRLIRFGNDIFDMATGFILIVLVVIFLVFFGVVEPDFFDNIDPITDRLISITFLLLFYFISEAIWQRTPGKLITGTKVIASDGTKPTLGAIAIRTLVRFVPFDAFSFLGDRVRGWHDKWSGTYVIKAKRFEKKSIDHNQIVTCPQQSFVVETPEKSVDILSVSHKNVEVCENCGRTIGKLEHAYGFKNHIVCRQCHEKLKKQI